MNNKKSLSPLFLAGYILLLVYSSFHFHTFDISSNAHICKHENTLPGSENTDTVFPSSFTCQFNLFYNSVISLAPAVEFIPALKPYKGIIKERTFLKISINNYFLSDLLRAPPALPVIT